MRIVSSTTLEFVCPFEWHDSKPEVTFIFFLNAVGLLKKGG